MKKVFSVILIMAMILNFLPVFSASSLPFSDADYMREGFGFKDYEEYVTDSIDRNGCEWPQGTKVIADETPSGHKSLVQGKKAVLPEEIEIIGHSCFMGRNDITDEVIDFTKLTELKFIDRYAFRETKLKRIDLSRTKVVKIADYAFYMPSLSTFIAPPTLKYIGEGAMAMECAIEYIELNEGLEYIGNRAFQYYKGKLVIPSTVKHIGYLAMPCASVYVHKGSYAEQWCNENNVKYKYVQKYPDSEQTETYPHIKHPVGPLMIEGYYTHLVTEYTMGNGEKVVFYRVDAIPGVAAETLYDGVEVYYTIYWTTDGEFENNTATADKPDFKGFRGGNANIYEYGVSVQPTQRLSVGWKKGVRWTFDKPKINSSTEHRLIVKYDGMIYRYLINIRYEKEYNEARKNPHYNKMGFFSPDSAQSATSRLIVDGKEYAVESYNFGGNNYFRLRDMAMFVSGSKKQFDVTYNDEKKAVDIITDKAYTPVGGELKAGDGLQRKGTFACPSPVYCDGKEVLMRTRLVEGSNYIMLRDLGKIVDFEIIWDDTEKCIIINTDKSYK